MSDSTVREGPALTGPDDTGSAAFAHQAYLYDTDEQFLEATSAFVEEGLDAGDAVLVAVDRAKIAALTQRIGAAARHVEFADVTVAGRNPARIIPLWSQFLHTHRGGGVRGIGEPVWPERTQPELTECHLHEHLLNVAFGDGPGWSLLCPYDVGQLDPEVVATAHRTHPHIAGPQGLAASPTYHQVADHFRGELPTPPLHAKEFAFDTEHLRPMRQTVADWAQAAGLPHAKVQDLVLAVSELATNSIRHGVGHGVLQAWQEADVFVCDVSDTGRAQWDPLVGRRPPRQGQLGGMGIWIVNQLCDLVQVRSTAAGTSVRLHLGLAS